MNYDGDASIFDVSHSTDSRARSIASSSDAASTVVHWIRVTVNSGIVLLVSVMGTGR